MDAEWEDLLDFELEGDCAQWMSANMWPGVVSEGNSMDDTIANVWPGALGDLSSNEETNANVWPGVVSEGNSMEEGNGVELTGLESEGNSVDTDGDASSGQVRSRSEVCSNVFSLLQGESAKASIRTCGATLLTGCNVHQLAFQEQRDICDAVKNLATKEDGVEWTTKSHNASRSSSAVGYTSTYLRCHNYGKFTRKNVNVKHSSSSTKCNCEASASISWSTGVIEFKGAHVAKCVELPRINQNEKSSTFQAQFTPTKKRALQQFARRTVTNNPYIAKQELHKQVVGEIRRWKPEATAQSVSHAHTLEPPAQYVKMVAKEAYEHAAAGGKANVARENETAAEQMLEELQKLNITEVCTVPEEYNAGVLAAVMYIDPYLAPVDDSAFCVITADVTFNVTSPSHGFQKLSLTCGVSNAREVFLLVCSVLNSENFKNFAAECRMLAERYPALLTKTTVWILDGDQARRAAVDSVFGSLAIKLMCLYHAVQNINKHMGRSDTTAVKTLLQSKPLHSRLGGNWS